MRVAGMAKESGYQQIGENLLQIKLYRPRTQGGIPRPRLIERLQQHLDGSLTLVSAPAGYGKSMLINQWMEQTGRPGAWLSLDEYDSTLGTVVSYVVAALTSVFPEIGSGTQNLLRAASLSSPERLAESVLHDIEGLPQPIVLTIDDYHAISDAATHTFMARFVELMPRFLQLVLITRVDPPFSLARLRGQGLLHEVRAAHLRFDHEETADLLQDILEEPLPPRMIDLLAERTEGWPAGLRLAAISLQDTPDPEAFVSRFAEGNNRLLMDYVVDEVLAGLPDSERALLMRMSVLDRFCVPLLAAISEPGVGDSAGQQLLERLWGANLFLIALDDSGTWFRQHHLFRDLLRQQLIMNYSAGEVALLSARASNWSEEAGLIEDALKYAVRAADPQRAAQLVEARLHEALNVEEWRRLERWLAALPEQVKGRPGIVAAQLAVDQIRFKVRSAKALTSAARGQLESSELGFTPSQRREWEGMLDAYEVSLFSPDITPFEAIRLAERALESLPPQATYIRSLAALWQVYAMQMSGKPQAAAALAESRLQVQPEGSPVFTNRMLLALGTVYYGETDLRNLMNTALVYRRFAHRSGQTLSIGWSAFLLGWTHYQNNELKEAEQSFAEVRALQELVHVRCAIDSLIGLALTQNALQRKEEARHTLGELRALLLQHEAIRMLPLADTLAWRLGFAEHSALLTSSSITPAMVRTQLALDLWEVPALTMARADIESRDPERLTAAENVLRESRQFASSRNSKRLLLRVGALEAFLHLAREEPERATATLRDTVLLGERGGARREILDIAPALYPQIRQLAESGLARGYLEGMLACYSPLEQLLLPAEAGQNSAELAGVLTYREVEVLLLVERRLSNQQIAQRLYVSPHTVKKHTVNIYRKLDVKNRREAVALARALHLLPESQGTEPL